VDVRVVATPRDVAVLGAAAAVDALRAAGRGDATLMPALGSSALGVYDELGAMRRRGELDTSRLRLVQLDEYQVDADDVRSLIGWLRRDVAAPLAIPDERLLRLDGAASDAAAACRAYDEAVVAAGGIDVAVLGLGPNGHLGFNEPPSDRSAPTRRVQLAQASLESNARYWPGLEVPAAAITAGMPTILGARRIVLVVSGSSKSDVLRAMLRGPVGPDLPASFLREHLNALLIADRAAWPLGEAAS
jgi:glucosamine-6-phosphate deaminase